MPDLTVCNRYSSGLFSEGSHHGQSVEIFKALPGECNEFFVLDIPAEE